MNGKWFDRFCWLIFLLVALYVAFHEGRYFEGQIKDALINEIRMAWQSDKMVYYGANYYFVEDRGPVIFRKEARGFGQRKEMDQGEVREVLWIYHLRGLKRTWRQQKQIWCEQRLPIVQ